MTNQFTPDNLKELKAALKNQNFAPYHRRLQAILLRSEGLSFKKIADLTGYVPQTVKNQVDGFVRDIPAELDNIVTVGSVDDDDYISSFSNRGSSVDIYATGGGTKALAEVGYENWVSKKLYEKDWVIFPTLEGEIHLCLWDLYCYS